MIFECTVQVKSPQIKYLVQTKFSYIKTSLNQISVTNSVCVTINKIKTYMCVYICTI